jgi:hypothetical protein
MVSARILRRNCRRFGRGGAFAFDQFGGQTFGFHRLAAKQTGHHVHRGHGEPEFGLADGGQWHAKELSRQHIAEADERDVLGNPQPLGEQRFSAADGDEVIHGLHRGGVAGFVEHL